MTSWPLFFLIFQIQTISSLIYFSWERWTYWWLVKKVKYEQFPINNYRHWPKGDFFSEKSIHFLDLHIFKENYSKKLSLASKFKYPANYSILLLAGNLNFKLIIAFWNIFLEIWRFKKYIALSEKKPLLVWNRFF